MKKKNNKIILPILVFFAFIGGAIWSYLVLNQLNKDGSITTSSGGNYTINENSISKSVDKVYDATVVVQSYKDGSPVSTGTGFVYKKEGSTAYIMTNNHVISQGNSAKVVFSDGSSTDTKILGGETYSDIAVLTVSAASIKQVATIGNTENIRLGDTTFAVGAPLGDTYSGTVTKGILSGKDRLVAVSFSGNTSDYYMKVLQTDAALNALYYAGVIEKGETVRRPYIGISMLDITDSYYLWQSGITLPKGVTKGVAVLEVVSSSPAEKAGLQKGDIITKIEKEEISSVAELRYELYKHNPGDKVVITYNRNGKELTSEVTLEEVK